VDELVVRSKAEAQAATEAGHDIVTAQVVLGMKCDICGPIQYPLDRLLLADEGNQYLAMHWLAKHPGIPRRSEREQVIDGQHREGPSIIRFDNHKENDR
jgi:hypothetical protein